MSDEEQSTEIEEDSSMSETPPKPMPQPMPDTSEEDEEDSSETISYSDAKKSIVKNWILKANNINDTILETMSVIKKMTDDDYAKHGEEFAELLSKAKNADDTPIFRDVAEASDYLNRIRMQRQKRKHWSTSKMLPRNDDMQRLETFENAYSRSISPMMKRSRLATTVSRAAFLKSYA